ncbi:MAG TPA: hypothetical protein VKQ36_06490, partial [Ktedonobacterales bacterium]|nr:hypothetical protein [Ktedonobacterales bacterium]
GTPMPPTPPTPPMPPMTQPGSIPTYQPALYPYPQSFPAAPGTSAAQTTSANTPNTPIQGGLS